jgi:hypothetical protein
MPQIKNTVLQIFGKALRGQRDGIVEEPLPRRWVDLIHHLDEQERKRSKPLEAQAEASTGEGGRRPN